MNEVNYSEFMRKNGILSMISQMQIMRKEMNWSIIQKSNVCQHNDAQNLVSGVITVEAAPATEISFNNNIPFTNWDNYR